MKAALVLALSIVAVSANKLPLWARQEEATIVCETSDGSPLTEDVTEMINNMKSEENKPKNLCVVGSFGNDCTPTIRDFSNGNSAAFQLCGEGGGGRFSCDQGTRPDICGGCSGLRAGIAAAMLTKLQTQCEKDGKVGGYYDYPNGDFKLIHS